MLGDASRVSGTNWKEDEEASASSLKQVMHSTNALEHTLILKCVVTEHVSMILISLSKSSCSH